MRTFGFAIAVAAAMFVLPVNAQRFEIGPGGVRIGGDRPSQGVCAQLDGTNNRDFCWREDDAA